MKKGNLLLELHGLLFLIYSNESFLCPIPERIVHITALVTQIVQHWLEHETDTNNYEYQKRSITWSHQSV